MTTIYWVTWQEGGEPALDGRLRVGSDRVQFRARDDRDVREVLFVDLIAITLGRGVIRIESDSGREIRIDTPAAASLAARLRRRAKLAVSLRQLRREHRAIEEELAQLRVVLAALPDLRPAQRQELATLAAGLVRNLGRHAELEELEVYPVVTRRIGDRRLAEAMIADHREVGAIAAELAEIGFDDPDRLGPLLHRLDAIVALHIAKEETIVFPLLGAPGAERRSHPARGRTGPRGVRAAAGRAVAKEGSR